MESTSFSATMTLVPVCWLRYRWYPRAKRTLSLSVAVCCRVLLSCYHVVLAFECPDFNILERIGDHVTSTHKEGSSEVLKSSSALFPAISVKRSIFSGMGVPPRSCPRLASSLYFYCLNPVY